ncbi:MAG TPA: NifU family protein [Acidimicrobiales bacterium]|nr:NifU family protein [Acidimicrobiales bacterium]
MSDDRDDLHPALAITAEARATVIEAMSKEKGHGRLALWLEVTGADDSAYVYDMYFRLLHDARPGDVIQHDDDLPVVIPRASIDRLHGARLDVAADAGGGVGLVVINPNTPRTRAEQESVAADVPPVDLASPLARRVVAALESEVNPSIAEHGGRADLVTMDGSVVHLRLSGGCQGCGMAKATLAEGIDGILREAVPEITGIVDVTNHAEGSNPFYQSAPG